jgi:hypothetical protein
MERRQFATIAKALFAASNRRRTLTALLGAALATQGAFGLPGLADADAKRGNTKGRRKKKQKRCPATPECPTCPATPECPTCPAGCPTGTEPCGGECRPVCSSTEVRNPATCACVACTADGDPCSGQRCCSGVCGCTAAGCVCRRADCVPAGGDCTDGGSLACCEGVCSAASGTCV